MIRRIESVKAGLDSPTAPNQQRGMALVFALVVLLILTILGISTLRTSSLEQLMSGNTQEQTRAYEAADSGASQALNTILNSPSPTSFNQGGAYAYSTSGVNGESSTAHATVTTPTVTMYAFAKRGPKASSQCTLFTDQVITGWTENTGAQVTLHQGFSSPAPRGACDSP